MKFSVSQHLLTTSLALVSRAVSSRPSHPVLANILLDADEDTQTITLNAFDLSLGIQVSFPADISKSGKIALPAKLLTDIVSRQSEGNLTFEQGTIEASYQVEIRSLTGKFKIYGMSADEYPELPSIDDGQSVVLPVEAMIEGLRSTLFSASSDETKQVLCGVHITQEAGGLEFASTTGHVLSVFNSVTDVEPSFSKEKALEATIPAKALQELAKMLERQADNDVTVHFDQSQVVLEWTDQRLTSRLLEGQYPNYRQLIPRDFSRQVTADRRQLLSALERIAVIADQKNNIVKLTLDANNQRLLLSVDAQDVGSGKETIPAQITGDDMDVAFNVKYLMDGLKAIATSEISMQLNTATSPAIVSPLGGSKMTYLIMPCQTRG